MVQEAVASPVNDRGFEATSYHYIARAYVASEKVGVVAMGLEAMRQAAAGKSEAAPDIAEDLAPLEQLAGEIAMEDAEFL